MLKQWLQNMKRKDLIPNKHSVLCSEHFKEEDFDRTGKTIRLRVGAVPSIFNIPEHLQKVIA